MLIKVGGELLDFDSLAYAWPDQTNPEKTKILFKVDNLGGGFFIPIPFEDFALVMEQAANLKEGTLVNNRHFFDADDYLSRKKKQEERNRLYRERKAAQEVAEKANNGEFSEPKNIGQD